MSGALVTETNNFFYVNLSFVNNTEQDQPCEILLNEDAEILRDPSSYMLGVMSFSASLGAATLRFAQADAVAGLDRSVTYRHRFAGDGRFTSVDNPLDRADIRRLETRSLEDDSFSVTDMLRQLNPRDTGFVADHPTFGITGDGRVALTFKQLKKAATQEEDKVAKDSLRRTGNHAVDVTLSPDLCKFLDLDGAPIERFRHVQSAALDLHSALN